MTRGFAALLSVFTISIGLVSMAATAGEEAYRVRSQVLRAEEEARALAAARSCAASAHARWILSTSLPIAKETVRLGDGMSCAITAYELTTERYRVETAAWVGMTEVHLQTDFHRGDNADLAKRSRRI